MPATAVPSAVEKVTVVAPAQEPPGGVGTVSGSGQPAPPTVRLSVMVAVPAFSVTSKVSLLNSITPPASSSMITTSIVQVATRAGGGGVTDPQESPAMVVPTGLLNTTSNDSSPSKSASLMSVTLRVFTLSSGPNVMVPLVAV